MSQPSTDPYWSRVRQLFHEIVETEPSARAAMLASCEDAGIRDEVRSLLAAHEESDSFLDRSLWQLAADSRQTLEGTVIGAYKLVSSLGEGGMGSVFLAVRDDGQFDQHVAIKLIRGGAAGNSLVQRFRQERQILAAFEHPNIARLLDGGTTTDGSPYLVMEYVDGVPIDRYCDEHHLTVRERLRLFLRLCEAVQYAHRNLVIHRDIKPANVLITADGTPKLLDFGIAKLMSHAVADATVTRMMTPDYASPEQLRGEPVTTATDVYSLGVLLYELLTGSRPFQAKRTPQSEAERPSTRVRSLRGDLDNIFLKVLAADLEDRYESVEQFAEDVRRHLSGHPVLARGDSFSYRSSKFIRRNRLVVAAASLALAAMIIAFGVTLRQKQIAERRFQELRSLARAVVFDIHDAIAPLPGSTRARAILVRQALVYLDNLAREAADNSELQLELASAYLRIGDVQGRPYQPNLGDTEGALASYRKALGIAESAFESEPENDQLRGLLADAHDRIGVTEQRALDWPSAMEEHQSALNIRNAISKPTPRQQIDLATTWVAIGDSAYIGSKTIPPKWRQWTGEEAYRSSLRVLASCKPTPDLRGEYLTATARAHQRLGGMYSAGKKLRENPRLCLTHHDAALRALGELVALDPSSGTARRNYADQHVMKATAQNAIGDYPGALASARGAIIELSKLASADPTNVEAQHDIAFALETAGRAQLRSGQLDDAERSYNEALAILTRLTANDPNNREDRRGMIGVLSGLAGLEKRRGNAPREAAYLARTESLKAEITSKR